MKNPVLDKLDEFIANVDNRIENGDTELLDFLVTEVYMKELRQEIFAKTNYVNSLIDQAQEQRVELNAMAENNFKLIETIHHMEDKFGDLYGSVQLAGKEFNSFRSKVSELVKGSDFIQSKDLLALLGEYEQFTVDEDFISQNIDIPMKVEVDYE